MGRNFDLDSLSQMTGEGGTDQVLDLAGLGESPWVVRVRKRCRRFAVAGYRLEYFEVVAAADSCFVNGCHRYLNLLIVAGLSYKVEVGCVSGMENSAGHSWMVERLAVREGRVGSADCTPG